MPRTTTPQITKPLVILCEGAADKAFLETLIKTRQLPEFDIYAGHDLGDGAPGGIDAFGQLLVAVKTFGEGYFSVTDILIVADNDVSPPRNFKKIQGLIRGAGGYPIPEKPQQRTVASSGGLAVTMLMIPWTDHPGTLETLCLAAAHSAASEEIANCVEAFSDCLGEESGQEHLQTAKRKLAALLIARNPKNPFVGLRRVWNTRQSANLIPLGHPSFDPITQFLKSFAS